MIRLSPAIIALAMTGCAARPAVDLRLHNPTLASEGAVAFRLTDSVIALGVPAEGAATNALAPPVSLAAVTIACDVLNDAGSCPSSIRPFVAPVDFVGATYAVVPRDRQFVETRLAATYVPDSLRLAELAVAVKDHRVAVINAVGTLAAMAAGAKGDSEKADDQKASSRTMALRLPAIIDLADAKLPDPTARCRPAGPGAGPCRSLPGNPGWSYRLTMTDDPAAQGFAPRARLTELRDVMVASLCRPAQLTLDYSIKGDGPWPVTSLRLTVADPDWLLTAALPVKGQIGFHSLCGMNLKREDSAEIGADEMATALTNQVRLLRSAGR